MSSLPTPAPPARALARVHHLLGHLQCQACSAGSAAGPDVAASPGPMSIATADLCDTHPTDVTALPVVWRRFGGRVSFHGPVHPLKVFEDNALVRSALETPGDGRVLLVDGGGSLRAALVGDQLATLAIRNQWAGIVVHGAIRDSAAIDAMPIGVHALGTCPVKSQRRGMGVQCDAVDIAGVQVQKGDYLYADADGILVAKKRLH